MECCSTSEYIRVEQFVRGFRGEQRIFGRACMFVYLLRQSVLIYLSKLRCHGGVNFTPTLPRAVRSTGEYGYSYQTHPRQSRAMHFHSIGKGTSWQAACSALTNQFFGSTSASNSKRIRRSFPHTALPSSERRLEHARVSGL